MRDETVVSGTPMMVDYLVERQVFLKTEHERFAIDGLECFERVCEALGVLGARG